MGYCNMIKDIPAKQTSEERKTGGDGEPATDVEGYWPTAQELMVWAPMKRNKFREIPF